MASVFATAMIAVAALPAMLAAQGSTGLTSASLTTRPMIAIGKVAQTAVRITSGVQGAAVEIKSESDPGIVKLVGNESKYHDMAVELAAGPVATRLAGALRSRKRIELIDLRFAPTEGSPPTVVYHLRNVMVSADVSDGEAHVRTFHLTPESVTMERR